MKVICGWCDKHLSGDRKDEEISHGICGPCETEFNKQLDRLQSTEVESE